MQGHQTFRVTQLDGAQQVLQVLQASPQPPQLLPQPPQPCEHRLLQ